MCTRTAPLNKNAHLANCDVISRDPSFLNKFWCQHKYIKDMLKKFGMSDSKAISTPMGTNDNLDSDASENMVDQKLYWSMIGSLLYEIGRASCRERVSRCV